MRAILLPNCPLIIQTDKDILGFCLRAFIYKPTRGPAHAKRAVAAETVKKRFLSKLELKSPLQ